MKAGEWGEDVDNVELWETEWTSGAKTLQNQRFTLQYRDYLQMQFLSIIHTYPSNDVDSQCFDESVGCLQSWLTQGNRTRFVRGTTMNHTPPTHPATWQIRSLATHTASMWGPLTLKPILHWDMNSSGGLPCVNSVMIFIRVMIHPTHNCHKLHPSAHSYAGITHEYLHGANESNY